MIEFVRQSLLIANSTVLHGILGEEQLGGASADAQSYWQGRFAACAFVGGFLGIGRPRNSWGVAPNPSRDAVPAPCKGQLPLDPFWLPSLVALSYYPLPQLLCLYQPQQPIPHRQRQFPMLFRHHMNPIHL